MFLCERARILENYIRRIQASQMLHGVTIQRHVKHLYYDTDVLFASYQLLLESILLFKQWSNETRDVALDAARFICQIRALVRPSDQLYYHPGSDQSYLQLGGPALFMAGLVLNEVEFSEGFLNSWYWTNCSTCLDQEAIGGKSK
jgi:hypothetical protein